MHDKLNRLLGAKMATAARSNKIQIDRLELGPFSTNAYILTCRKTGDSVVIDVPSEAGRILEELEKTHPQNILITHNHFDHAGALSQLPSALNVSVVAHPADAHDLPVPHAIVPAAPNPAPSGWIVTTITLAFTVKPNLVNH
jgi:glyoxylase-like metal-dependent hydrolase (beta-lactamase superfamily II)